MPSRMTEKNQQTGLFEEPPEAGQPELSAEMYCDGACSGNPGKSGIGVVITISGGDTGSDAIERHYRISESIGTATNNIAEYSALIRGLEKARSLGIKRLNVFLDSELIVRQMNGMYKVKNQNLMPLWNRARDILASFDRYTITHVRREMNQEADSLARRGVSKL